MTKHGKKYRQARAKIEADKLLRASPGARAGTGDVLHQFDGTVEVHIRLGVDPKAAEQQVRDTVMLPHGLGKTVRVLVFAEGDAARRPRRPGRISSATTTSSSVSRTAGSNSTPPWPRPT